MAEISPTLVPTTANSSTKVMADTRGPVSPRDSTTMVRNTAMLRLPLPHISSPTGRTGSSTEGMTACMTAIYF